MEPNTEVQTNKPSPMVIVGGGLILVLLVVFFILMRKPGTNQKIENTQNNQQAVVSTAKPTIARFGRLDITAPAASMSIGQDVIITISGDSVGKEIVGYDGLVTYDKTALMLQSAKSIIKDFTIFKFDRSNHLSLTAVKNLNSKTPTILSKTPMAELIFKAVKPGTYSIEIQSDIDKESTKMVDEKTNVLYPNLSSVMVSVK